MAFARIASALLAALIAASPLRAQPGPVPPNEDATLPPDVIHAQRDRYQRMTVPVTIEGKGPYRFLVDTGAQATVITPRVTDTLGLVPSGRATLVAMASRTQVDTVELDGLEFAGRQFNNLKTPLLRDHHIGADGIIGLDTLQDLRVIIDFKSDAITVADATLDPNSAYEIVVRARRRLGQMIITDAEVDGVRTAVIIDTGSWHSIGNTALQRRLRARHSDAMVSTDVAGVSLRSDVAMLGDLTIGALGLSNLLVGFSDSPAFDALGYGNKPALILGIGNLRPFDRVAIDFSTRRILFDVPRGAGRQRLDSLFMPTGS